MLHGDKLNEKQLFVIIPIPIVLPSLARSFARLDVHLEAIAESRASC